jgi:hypothetical protein
MELNLRYDFKTVLYILEFWDKWLFSRLEPPFFWLQARAIFTIAKKQWPLQKHIPRNAISYALSGSLLFFVIG